MGVILYVGKLTPIKYKIIIKNKGRKKERKKERKRKKKERKKEWHLCGSVS